MQRIFKFLSRASWLGIASFAAATMVACGGGGSGTSAGPQGPGADTGEVVIGLTDAEGDFLTYSVDVLSLSLTRADGTQVETVPLSTRVDFAQYQDLTEFFTAATIPQGVYTAGNITLDFARADVQVEVSGQAAAAIVRDESGSALGEVKFAIDLADDRPLLVRPGIPAHLTVDFDLAASHTVDTSVTPPLVTTTPVLIADVEPDLPKPHRLRGLLRQVSESNNVFFVDVRPFRVHDGAFGRLPVYVGDDTQYEIDGQPYSGAEGLTVLAAMDRFAPVVVFGQVVLPERRFVADEVNAGSSVPGAGSDVVRGTVIARDGDVLTVKGATVVRANGSAVFNDEMEVALADTTRVTRVGSSSTGLTIDAVSVGQGVIVFGTLTGDSAGGLSLDAGTGRVRMLLSQVAGEVVSRNPGLLVMDVQRVNGRDIGLFDFSGTGVPGNDADRRSYEVDTGSLSLDDLLPLDPVKVRGFVTPFGSAPADFEARTLSGFADQVSAQMGVSWNPASAAAFSQLDADGMVVNLDGAGTRHHVRRAGILTDLADLSSAPTLIAAGERGIYAIVHEGRAQIYRDFAEFTVAVAGRLGEGAMVAGLAADGGFDNGTATFQARSLKVILR